MSSGNVVNILVKADGSKATSSFEKVRKSVMLVSAAVAGIGLALSKVGDEFIKANNNIVAGTGATGAELADLQRQFRDLARDVPESLDQVSRAIADVSTKLKLSGNSLETTTKAFLDWSRVMGMDVTPLIRTVSNSMDMFGMSSSEATKAMAMFTRASQTTGVPVDLLAAKVEEFGPVLRNLGMDLGEATATLAQFEGAGLSISRIMPALNLAMRNTAASGAGDLREALEIASRAIKDADDTTTAMRLGMELFGSEGTQRMIIAIRDGVLEVDSLQEAMENAEPDFQKMLDNSLTSGDRFKMMANEAKLLVEPLAGLFGVIGPMVFILPSMASGIAFLLGLTATQTALTWLWVAAQTALNIVLSPMNLLMIAIVAIIVTAVLVFKHWDEIVAFLQKTFEKFDAFLTDKFGATWVALKETVSAVINAMKELVSGFIALFKGDFDGAKEHFRNFGIWMGAAWQIFVDKLWTAIDEFMGDKFGAIWTTAVSMVGGAIDIIVGYIKGLVSIVQGVWDLVIGIFTGDTSLVISGLKAIVNGFIEIINGFIKAINRIGFDLPDWLGGKSFSFDIAEIPKLARGGIVNSPTLAMIGEGGPEAVVPLNQGGGAMGGITVNVMMPEGGTVILDDESTAQRFGDFITMQIREALRTQGGF
tara:strand:+ start:1100 stop:3049 length:1950 start_codon:yes stop_codon:yes gene_type:complete